MRTPRQHYVRWHHAIGSLPFYMLYYPTAAAADASSLSMILLLVGTTPPSHHSLRHTNEPTDRLVDVLTIVSVTGSWPPSEVVTRPSSVTVRPSPTCPDKCAFTAFCRRDDDKPQRYLLILLLPVSAFYTVGRRLAASTDRQTTSYYGVELASYCHVIGAIG